MKNRRNTNTNKYVIPQRPWGEVNLPSDEMLFKAKMMFLLKEQLNPIRDSVTGAWAPINDIDGKECIRALLTIDDV